MYKYLILILLIILVIVVAISYNSPNKIGSFERITPLTVYKKTDKSENILGTFVKNRESKKSKKTGKTLAQKLTDAGWTLYIKDSCPWCHLQVDMFGTDKQYLKIVDCSKLEPPHSRNPANLDLANCKQVWVYPTWVNGSNILPGSQSFASLNDALNGKYYSTVSEKKKPL